jgi:hypothetical protein
MQALAGLNNTGLEPAKGAGATTGLTVQAMPAMAGMDLGAITNQLPDSWLTPDLKSGTIDWSMFNPVNISNYEAILNTAYKPKPTQPQKIAQPFSLHSLVNKLNNKPAPVSQGLFNKPPPPIDPRKAALFPLSYKGGSPSLGNGGEGGLHGMLDANAEKAYNKAMSKMAYVPSQAISFRDQKINDAIKALDINTAYMSAGKLNPADIAERDKRILDTSAKFGMSAEDLTKYLGLYDKAYQTIADPVGANWQDVKNTGDFYKNAVLPGVRRYSGYDDAFFNNLDTQASEGTRNSQKYLSPEYFALHGVTPSAMNMPGVKQGQLIGLTNPKLGEWYGSPFGGKYNNNPGVGQKHKKAGQGWSDPYKLTDWQDYLQAGESRFNATPEQKAAAEAERAKHMAFLSKKVEDGGPFNLWRETGVNPHVVTKTKGGKWKPRNSGYTNQLNIAQNYLPQASEGTKNYETAGFNADKAYQSGFYFDKKKKKFGGLGALLSIASFVPGPVGIAARVAGAINAAANKDYLGAVMGAMGAAGYNPLGKATAMLSKATGLSANVANAIVQGGMGGLGAISKGGNFAKGALGGGLGSYASGELGNILSSQGVGDKLTGIISGGAGAAINSGIQGQKGAPLLLSTAMGAYSGYNRGKNVRNKQKAKR